MFKKIYAAIFALLLSVLTFTGVSVVHATEASTEVTIKFVGDEAKTAGFAQSEITVKPGNDIEKEGYFLVYYTDGSKVLSDYDEAVCIKKNGNKTVKGFIGDGRMLPENAKAIAVFESKVNYFTEAPDIKNALAVAEFPEYKCLLNLGEAEFSFGALSDTHMNYEPYNRGAYAKLLYSMNFFAEQKMDAVIISGDVVGDRGENPDLEAQYKKHEEILNESQFPIEKVYEGAGNHGNTPKDIALLDKNLGGADEIHPYENSPYFHVVFEGKNGASDNVFIFMAQEMNAPGDSAKYDNFSKDQIDWLENLLNDEKIASSNLFFIIHSPFLGFGAGDIENGTYGACITFKEEYTQNMRLKALLEKHKKAVVFSGHTHVTFYDNANYSDVNNEFARTVHIGSNCQPCGYGEGDSMQRSFDGKREVTPEYGSEGYTVTVYSDYIVFNGYNFSTGKKIPAACLILPVTPYSSDGAPDDSIPKPESNVESEADTQTAQGGNGWWIWVAIAAVAVIAAVVAVVLIKKRS